MKLIQVHDDGADGPGRQPGVLQFVFIALFSAACLTVAALALGPPPSGLAPGQDKLLHFAAFAVLTILGALAFYRISVWAPAVGLLAGGIAIELLQGIPGINRSMSLADVMADAAGIAAGLVIVAIVTFAWSALRSAYRKFGHEGREGLDG